MVKVFYTFYHHLLVHSHFSWSRVAIDCLAAQVDKVILVEEEVDDMRHLVNESTSNATESLAFFTTKEVASGRTQDPSGCVWIPLDLALPLLEYYSTQSELVMESKKTRLIRADIVLPSWCWKLLPAIVPSNTNLTSISC